MGRPGGLVAASKTPEETCNWMPASRRVDEQGAALRARRAWLRRECEDRNVRIRRGVGEMQTLSDERIIWLPFASRFPGRVSLLVFAVLVAVSLVGWAPVVQALSCPAGSFLNRTCYPCDPGHASAAGSSSCVQVLSGGSGSATTNVTFPQGHPFSISVGDKLSIYLTATTNETVSFLTGVVKPTVTASEEWGLPEFGTLCGSSSAVQSDYQCTEGVSPTTSALLEFAPNAKQVGERYYICARATVPVQSTHVLVPYQACAEVIVVDNQPTFTSTSSVEEYRTPADGFGFKTAVGCPFSIPLEVSLSPCPAPPGCIISPASNTTICSDHCGEGQFLGKALPDPVASGSELPRGAKLSRRAVNAQGLMQQDDDRPQLWVLEWKPAMMTASQIPYRICLTAGMRGSRRCFHVLVEKCRHCLGAGDTLASVAALHRADWLQVYHANPSLPSHNPDVVAPGYNMRLGVSHRVRSGEYLEQLADKFLVSTDHLLSENIELFSPATLEFTPRAAGSSTQIAASFMTTRQLTDKDSFRLVLPELTGRDWTGFVSADCSNPTTTPNYGAFSQRDVAFCDESSAPGQDCGPGLWGHCRYDTTGRIRCETLECSTYGQHSMLSSAMWDEHMHTLTVHVRSGATIPHGAHVSFVISRSAGIRFPQIGFPEMETRVIFPVPTMIDIDGPRPYQLCVILPVCDSNLQCLYGSECSITQSIH